MTAQIRINELARELEVKAKVILDYLPEVGVREKKTHSSSIDVDAAEKVRAHFRAQQAAEEEAARREAEAKAAEEARFAEEAKVKAEAEAKAKAEAEAGGKDNQE